MKKSQSTSYSESDKSQKKANQDPYMPDENLSVPDQPGQDPPNPPNNLDHIYPEPDLPIQTKNRPKQAP